MTPKRLVGLGCVAALCLALPVAAASREQAPTGDAALRAELTETAERILLPERCAECHAAEFEVWETTEHATGFDTLHRRDRAKEIYRSLGLRLIKRGTDETTPACLACHYTPVLRREQLRAGAGVTCESCHGAAREWISIHNSYGVSEADFQKAALLETAEHRTERVANSAAAGMRRPSALYDVAANCFACHTVPNEDLVNRAGHSTGSDFELVEWSGRIRHNFLESYKTADGRTNAERPREWKRVMYVVGRALDLEYALRGVAAATVDELYFGAMSDRAGAAVDELFEINERVTLPAIQTIIATWESADLAVDNAGALLGVADAVQRATRAFVASVDGAALAPLDPLWDPSVEEAAPPARVVTDVGVTLEPSTAPVGEALASAVTLAADPPAAPPAPDPPDAASVVPPEPSGVQGTPDPPVAAPPTPAAPVAIAPRARPSWREPPAHDFVKVPCGRCHNAQEKWWRKDPHSETAKPFRNSESQHIEIAQAYGIASADIARGAQTCMWCHGTIVSAPARRVRAGVGCQRCHGAGADYLEPHETASHAASVTLGLTDLRDASTQASTCAGCHYITEAALINAGHPTGAEFDIASRDDIVHWGDAFGRETLAVDGTALAAAHAIVVAERGPPPARLTAPAAPPPRSTSGRTPGPGSEVTAPETNLGVARSEGTPTPPALNGRARQGALAREPGGERGGVVSRSRPPRSGPANPARRRVASAPAPLVDDPELDGLQVEENASVEEVMELLRQRLEQIYRALGRPPAQ